MQNHPFRVQIYIYIIKSTERDDFLFKIIEKASSACQISVILCNQLTTMLFSLAALVEQHPSKLVLHSLAGALTKNQHDDTD